MSDSVRASQTLTGRATRRSYRDIYIALGSNLGDRERTIEAALRDLQAQGDIRVVRCSRLHETEPVGGPPGQGRYLNAVAELETELPPRALLDRLLTIERRHGRVRGVANGPRTLDLDLLLYGQRVIDKQDLMVPHPRMWQRPFVMQPLEEICDARQLATCRRVSRTEPRA
jgi:2-amino-4-hydroxy-6-hydroxymethyldihydropteridine diphosphokinase